MIEKIINDPGGSIVQHAFDFAVMAADGVMFKVMYCASACIMALANVPMAQVCFYPQAWIGYHSPGYDGRSGESTTTMQWERGRDWIAKGYTKCS